MSILYFSKKKITMLLSIKQIFIANLCICFIILNLLPKLSFSQPVYAIAVESSTSNSSSRLVEYDPQIGYTKYIGDLDGNIRALAVDPLSGKIYTTKYNEFGTLNPLNAEFEKISDLGVMYGKLFASDTLREVQPDSIRCMAFDVFENVIYAVDLSTNKFNTAPAGTEDLLFKIDPNSGEIIKDAMNIDGIDETIDFAGIETVESTTTQGNGSADPIRDVWDITVNPFSGELCGYHRNGVYAFLTYLNTETGKVESDIGDVSFKDYLGVSFSRDGNYLLFTSGYGGPDRTEDPTILKQREISGNQLGDLGYSGFIDATVYNFKAIDYGLSTYLTFDSCQSKLNVTNMLVPHQIFKADSIINSNLFVSKDTEFYAGYEINISQGFEVSPDSLNIVPNFTAAISNCN